MVAPKVCTGFEFGPTTLAGWIKGNAGNKICDATAGTPAIVSTGSIRTGTYCLELDPAATIENFNWTTATVGTSQTRCVLAFGFQFVGSLPAGNRTIAAIQTAGLDGALFFRSSDSKLVADAGGTIANGQAGPTIVADTWYYAELYFDCSANTFTLDWWVDGLQQTQSTVATTADTVSNVMFGMAGSTTMTIRYDDVVVYAEASAITVPIHPHKVVRLLPSGTAVEIGTANATGRMVTNSAVDATFSSANIMAAIVEVPPLLGATATGVGQRTSGAGNAVGIPMATYTLLTGEAFSGLRVLVAGWAASGTAASLGMRTFNGTTEDILFVAADPAMDALDPCAWICKMAVDGRFDTQGEVDALVVRLGYSTDISPLPGAHAVYAEVAVKEAPIVRNVVPGSVTVDATPGTLEVTQAGGSQAVTPGSVIATATVGTLVVAAGAVNVVPAPVTAMATPGTLTVSLNVVPAPVTATATAGTVTVVGSGGSQAVTPAPVTATATAGTVTVVLTTQHITPIPVTVNATVGSVVVGDIPILPIPGQQLTIRDHPNLVLAAP